MKSPLTYKELLTLSIRLQEENNALKDEIKHLKELLHIEDEKPQESNVIPRQSFEEKVAMIIV